MVNLWKMFNVTNLDERFWPSELSRINFLPFRNLFTYVFLASLLCSQTFVSVNHLFGQISDELLIKDSESPSSPVAPRTSDSSVASSPCSSGRRVDPATSPTRSFTLWVSTTNTRGWTARSTSPSCPTTSWQVSRPRLLQNKSLLWWCLMLRNGSFCF